MLEVTNLRTDTGCTDDGKEGVSFWPHRHLNAGEKLGELRLVLLCWTNCVHKYLQDTREMKQDKQSKTGKDRIFRQESMTNLSKRKSTKHYIKGHCINIDTAENKTHSIQQNIRFSFMSCLQTSVSCTPLSNAY